MLRPTSPKWTSSRFWMSNRNEALRNANAAAMSPRRERGRSRTTQRPPGRPRRPEREASARVPRCAAAAVGTEHRHPGAEGGMDAAASQDAQDAQQLLARSGEIGIGIGDEIAPHLEGSEEAAADGLGLAGIALEDGQA